MILHHQKQWIDRLQSTSTRYRWTTSQVAPRDGALKKRGATVPTHSVITIDNNQDAGMTLRVDVLPHFWEVILYVRLSRDVQNLDVSNIWDLLNNFIDTSILLFIANIFCTWRQMATVVMGTDTRVAANTTEAVMADVIVAGRMIGDAWRWFHWMDKTSS